MNNLVSKKCVDFVKGFEGFSAVPYKDCVGVWTLGYGMTGSTIANLTSVTEGQASQMLEDLLNNEYASPIKSDLDSKGITLTQNQFDALVSMAYNVGTGGLLGSTLYKNVVSGVRDVPTITQDFQMWSMAGGERLEGLYRRRTEEAEMFFRNDNVKEADIQFNIHMTANIQNQGIVSTDGVNSCKIGTEGLSLRLEMFSMTIDNIKFDYSVHEENVGDTQKVDEGSCVGSIGIARRIEGITITVTDIPTGYKLQYRAHIQNIGTTDWVESGVFCGTKGQALRVEEIEVRIIKA